MAFQDIGIRIQVQGMSQFRRDVSMIDQSLNSITKGFGLAFSAGGGFGGMLTSLGSQLDSIGSSLTRNLTVPLVTALGSLVASGISFEQAFTGVTKTVDGLSDGFGNLTPAGEEVRGMIRQLALEMPVTHNEIARVMQVAGQLGVRGTDNLVAFTTEAIKLGIATDFASEEAASGFARLGNIMGIESEDMADFLHHAGNAIVDLGNNYATTEPEILKMALRFAGTAKVAGLTTSEILGLATAVSAMGVQSELGGSTISRIFMEMKTASDSFNQTTGEGSKQLVAFANAAGLDSKALSEMIKLDPSQAFLRIIEGISRMSEAGELSEDVLKAMNLEQLRVKEVLNKIGPEWKFLEQAMLDSNGAWSEQTALQVEYNKYASTTLSNLKLLRNSVVDLGIALFEVLSPSINSVIDSLTDLISKFKEAFTGDNDFQKKILGITAGLLVLGPALMGIGKILKIIGSLFSSFTFLFGILANPTVLIGIGALVGGFLLIKAAGVDLGGIFSQIADSFGILFDSLNRNTNTLTNLKNAFSNLLQGDFEGAFKELKFAVEGFVFWLQNIGWPIIKEEWLKLRPLLADAMGQIASAFWEWITNTVIPNVLSKLDDLISSIGTWIKDQQDPLKEKLKEWINSFADWAELIWPILKDKIEGLLTDIIGWAGDQVTVLSNKLVDWTDAFIEWAIEVWPGLFTNLAGLLGNIIGWILSAYMDIGTAISTLWIPAFIEWASNLWNGPTGGTGLKHKLAWLLYKIIWYLTHDFTTDVKNAAHSIGEAFVDGILEGLSSKAPSLTKGIAKLGESLGVWDLPKQISESKPLGQLGATDQFGNTYNSLPSEATQIINNMSTNGSDPYVNGMITTLSNALAAGFSPITPNSTRSTTYAPTINGVPMQNSEDAGKAAYNAFLKMYGVTNK